MARISIDRLSKTYVHNGTLIKAVSDASLEIADGEFICVVGHSGCGKTTLMNMLAGFITPTSGDIRIDGRSLRAIDTSIGVVFQEYALFPWLTALGNVAFGLEMIGIGKAESRERGRQFLNLVRLGRFVDAYPHELSGGMRQRVAVARAMAYDPALLLMDEPFGALDTQTRERLQALTQKVWLETHKTIFYVTHNLSEAVYLADRVVVMRPNPGHIHEIFPIKMSRPRDPLSLEFVEAQRYLLNAITHTADDDEDFND